MKARRTVLALAAVAAGGALQAQPATALVNYIQPGDYMETAGIGCTMNFVYDGTGANGAGNSGTVYMGTAAHCVANVGDTVDTPGFNDFGEVAWIGNANNVTADVALIEVYPAFENNVSNVVLGHSAPSGYINTVDFYYGDTIQISGWGMGFDQTNTTRQERKAVVSGYNDQLLSVVGPLIFGDSGGPLVHEETNKAMGIVSRICFGTQCPGSETGPTVKRFMQLAAAGGHPVSFRV